MNLIGHDPRAAKAKLALIKWKLDSLELLLCCNLSKHVEIF